MYTVCKRALRIHRSASWKNRNETTIIRDAPGISVHIRQSTAFDREENAHILGVGGDLLKGDLLRLLAYR